MMTDAPLQNRIFQLQIPSLCKSKVSAGWYSSGVNDGSVKRRIGFVLDYLDQAGNGQ